VLKGWPSGLFFPLVLSDQSTPVALDGRHRGPDVSLGHVRGYGRGAAGLGGNGPRETVDGFVAFMENLRGCGRWADGVVDRRPATDAPCCALGLPVCRQGGRSGPGVCVCVCVCVEKPSLSWR